MNKSFLNRSLSIIIISFLVNLVIIAAVSPVSAQSVPILYVDPPKIIDTTKTAGTDFTININVKDITDFYGYQIKLKYNTTLLDVNTVTLGSFFPSDSVLWVSEENRINETAGYIWYILTMPYGIQYGVDGSGTLLTIAFSVTSIGETVLDLDVLEVFNHKQEEMPRNVHDGYFSNILRPTRLYVDPEKKIDLDLVPGKNFTINVNVFNVTNLHSSEFKLDYDTRLLDVLETTEGSFMASFGDTNFVSRINETLGLVEGNVTLVDPIGAVTPNWPEAGNGTLAMVTFNVTAIGECDLYLYNTKLTDPTATPIEHYPFDGYFNNKDIIHDIVLTDVKTTVTTVVVEDGVSVPVSKPVSEVYAGEKVNITVFVKNSGTISENFNVTAYYNDTRIGTPMNITLSEGFVTSLVFEWNTAGVEVGSYIIWAETSPILGETNEDQLNNKFTMKDEFKVLSGGRSFPVELVVAAVAGVCIIAVIAVYLIKFRKPKPAAKVH